MNLMEDYLQLVNHEYKCWQGGQEVRWDVRPPQDSRFSVSQLSLIEIRCATPRCTFYISVDTQPHCHECFEKRRAERTPEVPRAAPPAPHAPASHSPPAMAPSPRSAPPTAPSLSLYSETHAMKCKTPGCLFTLSVEHDGLCEHCHSALRAGRRPAPDRCSRCQQEGFRTLDGLCPTCLQRTAKERAEPQPQVPGPERPPVDWPPLANTNETVVPRIQREVPPAGRKCKRQECRYFGTPEQLGFCSICCQEYQINREYRPVMPITRVAH